MSIPILETDRIVVRPLTLDDLDACHALYRDIGWVDTEASEKANLEQRLGWLKWTIASYEQLAQLMMPPYGERAVVDKASGQLVGNVGLVPLLQPFGQLPSFGAQRGCRHTPEVGLFWAVAPKHQRQGFATAAGRALIDFAFEHLRLNRIIAGTERDNKASMSVMKKLGMRIEENPFETPEWFQVLGILQCESGGSR